MDTENSQEPATNLNQWMAARAASTSPALVDLSTPGGRIELSGRVLCNWVAKNAGLLDSEFGVGRGTVVALEAPAHWRTIPLALAALALGATLVGPDDHDAELLITTDPGSPAAMDADEVLAVSLEMLALTFGSPLPPGVVDHAAEVRAQPDRFTPSGGDAGRWMHDGVGVGIAQILAEAGAPPVSGESSCVSLPAPSGLPAATVAVLAAGRNGSVVLHGGDELEAAQAASERVTRPAVPWRS